MSVRTIMNDEKDAFKFEIEKHHPYKFCMEDVQVCDKYVSNVFNRFRCHYSLLAGQFVPFPIETI